MILLLNSAIKTALEIHASDYSERKNEMFAVYNALWILYFNKVAEYIDIQQYAFVRVGADREDTVKMVMGNGN